jgi:hypothetical protein
MGPDFFMKQDESENDRLRVSWISHQGAGLFFASFLSLFLELLLIRWVPSLVRVVAYYGSLMLISSFLGLGYGAIIAHRRLELHRCFALVLLLLVLFGRRFR